MHIDIFFLIPKYESDFFIKYLKANDTFYLIIIKISRNQIKAFYGQKK